MTTEAFWLESPDSLFKSTRILPSCEMTKAERLNAITRLLLIAAVALFFITKSNLWLTVLITGLVVVTVIYIFNVKKREGFHPRRTVKEVQTPTSGIDTNVEPKLRRPGLIGVSAKELPSAGGYRTTKIESTVKFRKR